MSKTLFLGDVSNIFINAHALRHHMTHAEIILPRHLKGNQLNTISKATSLRIYIVDFYCHQHKLIIELYGSIHNYRK